MYPKQLNIEGNEEPVGVEIPLVEGGWGTVVADPPWPFKDMGSRATPGYLRNSPMALEEIRCMPVEHARAPDSHLYLWCPDTHLESAFEVVRAWGFVFKHLIPWVKCRVVSRDDKRKLTTIGPLQIGMGHYYRKAHEVCLFAVSGKAKVRNRGKASVIIAPRTRHSAKPEELQDLVELMSPGPYLELFARRQRSGWTCWGDECGSG